MKRTNGTDRTRIKKDTLEQKWQRIYGKPQVSEKSANSRFKCFLESKEHDDGYYFENSTTSNYDDEIYDD